MGNEPKSAIAGALAGILAAAPLAVALFGYTVDDALITARVASHLAAGQGQRFNIPGPVVDAVTPLGFAHLLALGGPGTTLEILTRARFLGLLAWLGGAAVLGVLLQRSVKPRERLAALGVLALSAPIAAWAGSGMETGLVLMLGCSALIPGVPGALSAGLAAGLRPELLPWAFVLGVGRSAFRPERAPRFGEVAGSVALTLLPALLVATTRKLAFGSFAPLAVLAKPSDLAHGLRYAAAAFLFGGAPLLLLAPRAFVRSDAETRVLALAAAVHFSAMALAGGDWMTLFRLLVPVLPTVLLAGARLATSSSTPAFALRVALAAAASMYVLIDTGLPARQVLDHRLALIERARPLLAGSKSIAALDAGWVGAASNASIVDLAGVTDPVVAALPGGHTSKRIPEQLLDGRQTDTWVLLLAPDAAPAKPWQESAFARHVEHRLSRLPIARQFELSAELPLGGTRQRYLVLRRK